jgi:hypothetical protein
LFSSKTAEVQVQTSMMFELFYEQGTPMMELRHNNSSLFVSIQTNFRTYTYLTLQAMPREDKQRWLELADLARKVKNYDNAPTPHLAVMRNFMQHWLN